MNKCIDSVERVTAKERNAYWAHYKKYTELNRHTREKCIQNFSEIAHSCSQCTFSERSLCSRHFFQCGDRAVNKGDKALTELTF